MTLVERINRAIRQDIGLALLLTVVVSVSASVIISHIGD